MVGCNLQEFRRVAQAMDFIEYYTLACEGGQEGLRVFHRATLAGQFAIEILDVRKRLAQRRLSCPPHAGKPDQRLLLPQGFEPAGPEGPGLHAGMLAFSTTKRKCGCTSVLLRQSQPATGWRGEGSTAAAQPRSLGSRDLVLIGADPAIRAVRAVTDARTAAEGADIICTVTSASTPILLGAWVRPGTHVNAVGSSYPGPAEIANDLVVKSRYVADSRRSALAAAAEFLVAKQAGLVDDAHIVAEIGEVLLGRVAGRTSAEEVTLYKSLGHIVQDLAAAAYVHARATGAAAP